jgi:ribosome-associated protein
MLTGVAMIRVTNDIVLGNREVTERFVRAFGARGQNVRKEATAVELRFDIGSSSLPDDVKARLMSLGGRAVTSDGVLVVASRAFRSQLENRQAAKARLLSLLQRAARPPKIRQQMQPACAARDERLEAKHRRSTAKRQRERVNV